jgi:hypothetical protein
MSIIGNYRTLDYLRPNYEALVQFFGRAAASGDALLLYIS